MKEKSKKERDAIKKSILEKMCNLDLERKNLVANFKYLLTYDENLQKRKEEVKKQYTKAFLKFVKDLLI